ncbi:MAG: AraC family transcriptional regulator [Flavobacteriaceae bacterium]|nr:AraC family transcriptional regulator [Bacteroidia bacterium]NNK82686.1 AraC family transcriptional regulator [Flavobacteriaceae bacterium]
MYKEIEVQEGFNVIKLENLDKDILNYSREVNSTFIQLHFCLSEIGKLHFGPHYSIEVKKENSLLLYNPNQNLPISLSLEPKSKYLIFIVSIKVFHTFFSQVAELIHFLDEENIDKKYYLDKPLTPSEVLVLNQLFKNQNTNSLDELYSRGKVYELLSLYFNKNNGNNQACPFLDDEENVEKIKKAKQIIIDNISEPPSLQELAGTIGLSLSKLKEGFKVIYGESVFNFLLDYKLEYARKMLLSKKYNVSEISLRVGYSTSSHFIAAFKKKYGTTPKQYIMSLT